MYVRLCESLNSIGKLVPVDQVPFQIQNDKDYYTSIFQYNEIQKTQAEESIEVTKDGRQLVRPKGVSGIRDVITNRLVFDFDSDVLENAQLDTLTLLQRLSEKNVNTDRDVNICFSGSKGFSVELNTTDSFTPQQFKSIVHSLAIDLKTFDPKIVDPNRIFRLPFTKHPKTGLYKTPLSKEELKTLNIAEIKDLAKTPSQIDADYLLYTAAIPKEIKELAVVVPKSVISPVNANEPLNFNRKPSWLSNWKYALSRGFFKEGMRSYALTILAATCKNQEMSKTQSYYFLKAAADEQVQRFGGSKFSKEEIWTNIIDVVFGINWQGGSWSEDNFPEDLKKFLNDSNIPREGSSDNLELIESVDEGFNEFISYAQDIEKNTMTFGIPSLDKNLKIRKGNLIGLLAPPSIGKTSFAVTLANNMSKNGGLTYFGSYDMYKNNVYQKLIQRHTGYSEEKIYEAFINRDVELIEKFRTVLKSEYENVVFCFKSGQSIQNLKSSIKDVEKLRGQKVDLVIVDYLELILTDKSDPTSASAEAAQGLREIANEGRVVLLLLQPNKVSSKPNKPLTSYSSAKGSSSIAQAVTAMITLHRPGFHSRLQNEDKFIGLDCVKNRNGGLFSLDFYWEGKTQTFSEIDDSGRIQLENVRRMVRELENDEDGDNW